MAPKADMTKKADPKAQALKTAKAVKSGPTFKKAKKIRTSVTFHRPKTLKKDRNPRLNYNFTEVHFDDDKVQSYLCRPDGTKKAYFESLDTILTRCTNS
ncbi:hypothetical protein Csa_018830 [Cucumis sativus]|nr:hypothetical protein Csa_018830 [Cucumis sativus]